MIKFDCAIKIAAEYLKIPENDVSKVIDAGEFYAVSFAEARMGPNGWEELPPVPGKIYTAIVYKSDGSVEPLLLPSEKGFALLPEIRAGREVFIGIYTNRKHLCLFKELVKHGDVSIWEILTDKVDYDKKKVIAYLRHGKLHALCSNPSMDVIIGKKISNNQQIFTDGEYDWLDILPYYIENYEIRLPEDFLKKVNGVVWKRQKWSGEGFDEVPEGFYIEDCLVLEKGYTILSVPEDFSYRDYVFIDGEKYKVYTVYDAPHSIGIKAKGDFVGKEIKSDESQ